MAVAQAEKPKTRTKKRKKIRVRSAEPVVRLYAPDEKWDIEVPTDLPEEDGEPLESNWHRAEINVLIESTHQHRQGAKDFYAGGNMFIYYSMKQALSHDYRGPDFFVVLNVDGSYDRKSWVVWLEDGRYPNVIVELLSPRTRRTDETTKKKLYAETFRTPEYFYYDPDELVLQGFRLANNEYVDLPPNEHGRLWSAELNVWLGLWEGEYLGHRHMWLRFFMPEGELVPTKGEAEQQRAEVERQRADSAEEQLARYRAKLAEIGVDPDL
jgi:Uma2 family endonuclease